MLLNFRSNSELNRERKASTAKMIEVEKLTKYYGDFPAHRGHSVSRSKKEEILGFLEPNAAGKQRLAHFSTCSCLHPGHARIAATTSWTRSLEVRKHIGYLAEMVPLYTDMSRTLLPRVHGRIRAWTRRD